MNLEEFLTEFSKRRGWAILAGSAVSMPSPTNAPMVAAAISGFLDAAEGALVSKEPRLGSFAGSVLNSIEIQNLTSNLKFELAMGHLNAQVPTLGDRVVCSLYSGRDPNPNHFAMAALHSQRKVNWLLTTNFDPALERASGLPAMPGFMPALHSNDAIIKLHGDAESGRGLVATLETMSQHVAIQSAKGLLTALMALGLENLLVVGYSGNGDVDILPTLVEAKSRNLTIWWTVRDGHVPIELEPIETIKHNLLGIHDNVLQRLAGSTVALSRASDALLTSDVLSRLHPILRSLSAGELVKAIVALLLEAHFGREALRILLASRRILNDVEFNTQMHLACERTLAYSRARKFLASIPVQSSTEEEPSSLARQAFLLQEASRPRESRRLYEEARSQVARLDSDHQSISYRTRDFVHRGWAESQKQVCFAVWNPSRRRELAERLLAFCTSLQTSARQEDVSTAAVLALRAAELAFAAAESAASRRHALEDAQRAMRDMMALQHAEGVAAAERFLLSAAGKVGQELVDQVNPWSILIRPRRDTSKLRFARLQGMLPLWLFPWKMRLPFTAALKRLVDIRASIMVWWMTSREKAL